MPSDKNDYISNISYINKDFETLWEEILATVPKLTDKWLPSEANESDPLVVLLKELAIVSDKINFNIDKNILELFPQTLTQLRSAMNVYESLGYTPDWYVSANLNLTFTVLSRVAPSDADLNPNKISKFTAFSNEDTEVIYTLLQDVDFGNDVETGATSLTGLAIEGNMQDFEINGSKRVVLNNLDTRNRIYFTERNVAQNGIFISNLENFGDLDLTAIEIDKESVWSRVDNLAQYKRGSKVFKFGIDAATNSLYLQFPDDIGDLIGGGLYIKYVLSSGEVGNIKRGTITRPLSKTSTSGGSNAFTYSVTNTTSSQNGKDPMTIAEMQRQFERVVGTFNTLVTLLDYEDYIYEYKTSLGNNIVSNIRMSDRTNDPEYSVGVVSMTVDGNTEFNTVTLNNPSGVTGMNAFDIRAYALRPVQSVTSQSELDTSFEIVTSTQEQDNIVKSIDTAKHIEHDLSIDGHPWVVPYDLSGQIYLKSRVSSIEASNVKYNVDTALYKKLQSRNVNWGETIDYQEIVDTIKEADDRIAYVALMPIQYDTAKLVDPINNATGYGGPSLEVRNVLCGNAPFTQFSEFVYPYGATNTAEIPDVKTIEPQINVTATGSVAKYKVGPNETFSVLLPKYKTDVQYTNYLYYTFTGAATGTVIEAGQLHRLSGEEKIEIFKDDEDTKAEASLTGGIIKPDFELKPTTSKEELRTNSIYVVSEAKTELDDGNKGPILIITNSAGLREAFVNGKEKDAPQYTLKRGEYFVYTNKAITTLAFLGEGTTLWATQPVNLKGLTSNITDILTAGDPTLAAGKYTEVSANIINVQINDIWNFSSGATIEATTADATGSLLPSATGIITGVWNMSDDVKNIEYLIPKDGNDNNTGTTGAISKLDGDVYKGYLSLAINLPDLGTQQALISGTGITQQIAYTTTSGTTGTITGMTIQSNIPITLDGVKAGFGTGSNVSILEYTPGATGSGVYVARESFEPIPSGGTTVPGSTASSGYCIVPFREGDKVSYQLYKEGTTIAATAGVYMGAPAFIPDSGATYYPFATGTTAKISDLFSVGATVTGLAMYATGSLGGVQYDYTYRPTTNQTLEKPSLGESYFESNHPYNKFTIAKLRSLSGLKISNSSIKQGGFICNFN